MTPLEILAPQLRAIDIPASLPRVVPRPGIYFLIDLGAIVYVGASAAVHDRLYCHAVEQRAGVGWKSFDSALWLPLPVRVHADYEGAFIRALCPRDNGRAPRHRGNDAEILDGFGISHLTDSSWRAHVAQRVSPTAIDGTAAARVRHARMRAGLTQAELARRVGLHRAAIHNWESGRRTPSDENLRLVATALGVSAVDLWSGGAN